MRGIFSPLLKDADSDKASPASHNFDNDDEVNSEMTSSSHASTTAVRARRHTLPLSMQLMKPFAHLLCTECGNSHTWPPRHMAEEIQYEQEHHQEDDLPGLRKKYDDIFGEAPHQHSRICSFISPMVVAPMMHSPSSTAKLQSILNEYRVACQFYGCPPNAGILTTLRYSLPSLRVSGEFHDADMLALTELLLQHGNDSLSFIRRLDFSIARGKRHGRTKTGFRSHGALALAKVLQQSQFIQQVWMQRNRVGPFGGSAIFLAASENRTLRVLNMRGCRLGEQGGLAFAELICSSRESGLQDVDLSANHLGFRACIAIEQAMIKRDETFPNLLILDLEGNLVFQEIMNGVTHGLGVVLAVLGSILLSDRVKDKSSTHVFSCAVYSTSLLVLYISSTLFHSFFCMQTPKYIFEVLDKCAIYILIAGSYTPFLQIVLGYNPLWSVYVLAFIWSCSFGGIYVEFAHPTWKHKMMFSLSMYLGLGWTAVMTIPEAWSLVDKQGINLVFLGGVAYTVGVPFFVRNNNLDHSIWHCFVLTGSIFHWYCIYEYVATR